MLLNKKVDVTLSDSLLTLAVPHDLPSVMSSALSSLAFPVALSSDFTKLKVYW